MRLLLVEDCRDMSTMLEVALSPFCFVSVTETALGAINLLTSHDYDFVLIDISLREGSGFDVAEFITQNATFLDCHIIFVTGDRTAESKYKALNLRADDFITKPIDINELVLKIKNKADYKRSIQRKYSANGHAASAPDSVEYAQNVFSSLLPGLSQKGQKLAQIIMTHKSDPGFGLEVAADLACISSRSLHRHFLQEFGLSFKKVLIRCRMEHSIGLLESGYDVGSVARESGFRSVNHFSKIFSEFYGMNPASVLKKKNESSRALECSN